MAAATHLVVTQSVAAAQLGQIAEAVVVEAHGASGLDPGFVGNISLVVDAGGSLLGTTTVKATAGTATFDDLEFDTPGVCQWHAEAVGLLDSDQQSTVVSDPNAADFAPVAAVPSGQFFSGE